MIWKVLEQRSRLKRLSRLGWLPWLKLIRKWRSLLCAIVLLLGLLGIPNSHWYTFSWHSPVLAQEASSPDLSSPEPSSFESSLPPLQVHPLPPTLAQWHDATNQGDYFSQVQSTEVGYLIWSHPVTVFVEPADAPHLSGDRASIWVESVTQAVREWNAYFPLTLTDSPEADITIWRRSPPLQRDNGTLRARSAETRYTLYIQRTGDTPPTLVHRFTITLRPGQTASYIQAAARHELGHALGIWGHSPLETDALYFSQVRNPAPISVRDINTLKRVYEQPTRLGM